MRVVQIDADQCTGCGLCVDECPYGAIHLVDGRARISQDLCRSCGACVAACPQGAITETVAPLVIQAPPPPAEVPQPIGHVAAKQSFLSRAAPVAAAVASFVGREVLPLVIDRMASRPATSNAEGSVVVRPSYGQSSTRGARQRHRWRGGSRF